MASLIYEGVMHRYPDLKVVIAHGGGYFPHYLGRMDRNTPTGRTRSATPAASDRASSCARSTTTRASTTRRCFKVLLERVGADRLVMGSDYPVGEQDPAGFVERCGVSPAESR